MSTQPKCRQATIEDNDFIYQSLQLTTQEAGLAERFSQTKNSLSNALFSSNAIAEALIVEVSNSPAGFALISETNRNFTVFNGPGLYLHNIFICEQYRRQGVGTFLFSEIDKIASTRNYCRIDWVVLNNNQRAFAFYKSINSISEVDYIHYMRKSFISQ